MESKGDEKKTCHAHAEDTGPPYTKTKVANLFTPFTEGVCFDLVLTRHFSAAAAK